MSHPLQDATLLPGASSHDDSRTHSPRTQALPAAPSSSPPHAHGPLSSPRSSSGGTRNLYAVPRRTLRDGNEPTVDNGSASGMSRTSSASSRPRMTAAVSASPEHPSPRTCALGGTLSELSNAGGEAALLTLTSPNTRRARAPHPLDDAHGPSTHVKSAANNGPHGESARTAVTSDATGATSPTASARLSRPVPSCASGSASATNSPAWASGTTTRLMPMSPNSTAEPSSLFPTRSPPQQQQQETSYVHAGRGVGDGLSQGSSPPTHSSPISAKPLSTPPHQLRAVISYSLLSVSPQVRSLGERTPSAMRGDAMDAKAGWPARDTAAPSTPSDDSSGSYAKAHSSVALPQLPHPAGRPSASPLQSVSTLEGAPALAAPQTPRGQREAMERRAGEAQLASSASVHGLVQSGPSTAWCDGHEVANTFSLGECGPAGEERPRACTASGALLHAGSGVGEVSERTRVGRLGIVRGPSGGGEGSACDDGQRPKAPASARAQRAGPTAAASMSSARASSRGCQGRWPTRRPHFLSSISPTTAPVSIAGSERAEASLSDAALFGTYASMGGDGVSGGRGAGALGSSSNVLTNSRRVSFDADPGATAGAGGGRASLRPSRFTSPTARETPFTASALSQYLSLPTPPPLLTAVPGRVSTSPVAVQAAATAMRAVLVNAPASHAHDAGSDGDVEVQEESFRSAVTPLIAQLTTATARTVTAYTADSRESSRGGHAPSSPHAPFYQMARVGTSFSSDCPSATLAPQPLSREGSMQVTKPLRWVPCMAQAAMSSSSRSPSQSFASPTVASPAPTAEQTRQLSVSDDWRLPFSATAGAASRAINTPVPPPPAAASAQSLRKKRTHAMSTEESRRPESALSSISLSAVPIYVSAKENDRHDWESVGNGGSAASRSGSGARSGRGASRSIPPPPWTPEEALLYQWHSLTAFERVEIHQHSRIYYCGERAVRLGLKHTPPTAPAAGDRSDGGSGAPTAAQLAEWFDEEDHHYRVIIGDHIAYRYEVIDVLGYGTYSVVVRVVDHASASNPRSHKNHNSNVNSGGGNAVVAGSGTGAEPGSSSVMIPPSPPSAQRIATRTSGAPPLNLPATASRRGSRPHQAGNHESDESGKPRVLAIKIIRNDPQYTAVAEEEVQLHEQLKRSFQVQRHESFRLLRGRASSTCSHGWRHEATANASVANSPRKRRLPEIQLASFAMAEARLEQDAEQGRCPLSQLMSHFCFRQHLILVFPLFGMDLGELFRINSRHPFPILITRSFMAQVTHALASVRRAGILHADVKPENILLVDRSEQDAELPTFSSFIAKLRGGQGTARADGGRASPTANSLNATPPLGEDRHSSTGVCNQFTRHPISVHTSTSGGRQGPSREDARDLSLSASSPPMPPHSNSVTAIPHADQYVVGASADGINGLFKVSTGSELPPPPLPAGHTSGSVLSLSPIPPPPMRVPSRSPGSDAPLRDPRSWCKSSAAASRVTSPGLVRRYSVGRVSSRLTLIDFSNARPADAETCLYPIQSQFYRSPEAALRLHYDERMDMWSLGCILYELVTGHTLFPVNSDVELLEHALQSLGMPDRAFLDKIKVFWKAYRAAHPGVGPVRAERSPSRPVDTTEARTEAIHNAVDAAPNQGYRSSTKDDSDVGNDRTEEELALETRWLALLHMLNRKAAVQAQQNASSGGSVKSEDTLVSMLTQLGEVDLLLDDERSEVKATSDVEQPPSGHHVDAPGGGAAAAERPPRGTEELVLLLLDFMLGCLYWDAEVRLRPEEAMRHPFLSGFFMFPKGAAHDALVHAAPSTQYASEASVAEASVSADGAIADARVSGVYFLRHHTLTSHRPYLIARAALYMDARAAVTQQTTEASEGMNGCDERTAGEEEEEEDDDDDDHGEHEAEEHIALTNEPILPAVHAQTAAVTDGTLLVDSGAGAASHPATKTYSADSWKTDSATSTPRAGMTVTEAPLPILRESIVYFPLTHPPPFLPGEERFVCEPKTLAGDALYSAGAAEVRPHTPTALPTVGELFLQDLGSPLDDALNPHSDGLGASEVTPVREMGVYSHSSSQYTPSSRGASTQSSPALARTLPARYGPFVSDAALPDGGAGGLTASCRSPSALHATPASLQLTTSTNTTSLHHQINQHVLRSVTTTPRETRALPGSTSSAISLQLTATGSPPQMLLLDGATATEATVSQDSPRRPYHSPAAMALKFD